jgi:hypothetical protein
MDEPGTAPLDFPRGGWGIAIPFDSKPSYRESPRWKPDEATKNKTVPRSGEPGRTRTSNPLLKRQLLYH